MPLNGSGTYAAPSSSFNPAVVNTDISATDWIALLADFTTVLTTAVYKDGQQTMTANLPMNSFKLTGLATGTSNGDSVRFEDAVAATKLEVGTTATTFTFDGSGGTSGSVTTKWQRIGNSVTLYIPSTTATTGTGSAIFSSNTALQASLRPAITQQVPSVEYTNNGAVVSPGGMISITTGGIITLKRDGSATAFTNSATGGFSVNQTITYYLV